MIAVVPDVMTFHVPACVVVANVKLGPVSVVPPTAMVVVAPPPDVEVTYPASFTNWEIEVVESLIVPVEVIARPVPNWNVFEAVPPMVIEEVVMNPLPLKSDSVFVATPKLDELIDTAPLVPFTLITYVVGIVVDGAKY